jgi:hypothetical protein
MVCTVEHALAEHVGAGAGDVIGRRRARKISPEPAAERRIVDDEIGYFKFELEPRGGEIALVRNHAPAQVADGNRMIVPTPRERAGLVHEPVKIRRSRIDGIARTAILRERAAAAEPYDHAAGPGRSSHTPTPSPRTTRSS